MSTGTSKTKTTAPAAPADGDVPPWERTGPDNPSSGPVTPLGEAVEAEMPAGPTPAPVAIWDGTVVTEALSSSAQVQKLMDWLRSEAVSDDESSETAIRDMIAAVMEADDVEGVLADSTTTGAEEICDIPLRIDGYRVRETDFAEGFPYFMVLDVFRSDTRQADVVTCGAFKVVAQVARLAMLNQLEGRVVMFKKSAKPTRSGTYPISLAFPV